MKSAHAGMGTTETEFNGLVDLVYALDKFKVAPEDSRTLQSVLGPMKSQTVGN